MTTNTEIKPDAHRYYAIGKHIFVDDGDIGRSRVAEFYLKARAEEFVAAIAERNQLRAALEAAQQQIAQSAGCGEAVATIVSRIGADFRIGWLRPEQCDVGTLLYTSPPAAKQPDSGRDAALPGNWRSAIDGLMDFQPCKRAQPEGMTRGGQYVRKSDVLDALMSIATITAQPAAAVQHDSDCSTNNRGVPELLGPCDCSAAVQSLTDAEKRTIRLAADALEGTWYQMAVDLHAILAAASAKGGNHE